MSIYVNAVWSEYDSSNRNPSIDIFDSLDSANKNCDPEKDVVLKFEDRKIANRYVKAFKSLCDVVNDSDDSKESQIQGYSAIDTMLMLESLEKKCERIIPK